MGCPDARMVRFIAPATLQLRDHPGGGKRPSALGRTPLSRRSIPRANATRRRPDPRSRPRGVGHPRAGRTPRRYPQDARRLVRALPGRLVLHADLRRDAVARLVARACNASWLRRFANRMDVARSTAWAT